MIISVSGKRRRGKTSFVVAYALNEYLKFFNSQYRNCCDYIKYQNKSYGTNLTEPPQRHTVYANFDIARKFPTMNSYNISGYDFGMPNAFCYTIPLLPYGVYIFDEAQKYWDSKNDKSLPPWVTQAFEWSGHIFLEIFLITQRYIRIHPDVRAIVDKFIYIEKSVHTFKIGNKKVKSEKFLPDGQLIKTEWYGRQFECEGDIEAYIKSSENRHLGEAFNYKFDGDIRKHYNPTAFAVNFENLDHDYRYFDYGVTTERPAAWDNYKQELKKVKKEGKEHAK